MSDTRALVSPLAATEPGISESGPFAKKPLGNATPAPLEAPTLLGRYALFGQIGAGGMGVVHLGRLRGSGGFERAVAIKRLHPSLSDDEKFVTMFREELRLLSRVRHQNVIAALDVLDVDDELLLVMDYVHGESLAALLQATTEAGRTMPPELAVTIACGVLKGLHAAHVATSASGEPLGIIHRDVSPHNVLVGCDGIARVLDFGVAKSFGSRQLTRIGELRGKPGYVSPEQIRGEALTARADVYSLSVVLWEMLVGRRLFGSRSLAQAIEDILAGSIPPFAALTEEPIPEALEALVRKGLSTNPSDRFENARDMAAALEAEVRLVSPEVVGAWVESAAVAALTERARQLAWCETCPLTDDEVTRIVPPPMGEHGDTWARSARTPTRHTATPPGTPATPLPASGPTRLPSLRPDSVRPEIGEVVTRAIPVDQLVPMKVAPATPLARPTLPPVPSPKASPKRRQASVMLRNVLFVIACMVAVLVGAGLASDGAILEPLLAAMRGPRPAVKGAVPSAASAAQLRALSFPSAKPAVAPSAPAPSAPAPAAQLDPVPPKPDQVAKSPRPTKPRAVPKRVAPGTKAPTPVGSSPRKVGPTQKTKPDAKKSLDGF